MSVFGLIALAAAFPPAAPRTALVCAHRGGALLWPENSLLAFRNAMALGVDLVETDVHLTADDEVVILHDATLDRTSTGRGPVRQARFADLAALRLRRADGAPTDEPVPTLAALLELVRPTPVGLLLEIKPGVDGLAYPGIEERVLALLRRAGSDGALLDRTVVMAFEPATIRRLLAAEPRARAALLAGSRSVPAWDAVEEARALGATYLGLHHSLIDPSVVAGAHRAGVRLGAWTVNDEAEIERVVGAGVDVVISDRPDVAVRVVRR